jgi:hypothetical protein
MSLPHEVDTDPETSQADHETPALDSTPSVSASTVHTHPVSERTSSIDERPEARRLSATEFGQEITQLVYSSRQDFRDQSFDERGE